MLHINYNMTEEQHKEYLRLVETSPKMSKADLFTAITGSVLCLGKTFFKQIGWVSVSKIFFSGSKIFFWVLIGVSIYKGIKKNCNPKTRVAGISQLIGSGISVVLMLR